MTLGFLVVYNVVSAFFFGEGVFMKALILLVTVCMVFSLCVAVSAQDEFTPPLPVEDESAESQSPDNVSEAPEAPLATDEVSQPAAAPPPPPPPPSVGNNATAKPTVSRPPANPDAVGLKIIIGPTDSQGPPRRSRGTVTVSAVVPKEVPVASVKIFANNALLQQKSQPPYEVTFDTKTVTDGLHNFKAIGADTSGKDVWSATTRVEVRNSAAPPPAAASAAKTDAAPPIPPPPGAPASPAATAEVKPTPAGESKPTPPGPATTPKPPSPASGAATADSKQFKSDKYGFSVNHPTAWTVKDKTVSMLPKKTGNAWIELSPADNAEKVVVNIKRSKLAANSDADTFAKYNPYVSTWERKTVDGEQAFATVSTESANNIIHRLIVVKGGYAWMLNCVDTSGKGPDNSAKLFESVVNSFKVQGESKAPAVKVIEVK
jgi:hypothetical protein